MKRETKETCIVILWVMLASSVLFAFIIAGILSGAGETAGKVMGVALGEAIFKRQETPTGLRAEIRNYMSYEAADDSFHILQVLNNIEFSEGNALQHLDSIWEDRQSIILFSPFDGLVEYYKRDDAKVFSYVRPAIYSDNLEVSVKEALIDLDLGPIQVSPGDLYLNKNGNLSYYHHCVIPGSVVDSLIQRSVPVLNQVLSVFSEQQLELLGREGLKHTTWDEIRDRPKEWIGQLLLSRLLSDNSEHAILLPLGEDSLKMLQEDGPGIDIARSGNEITCHVPLADRDCEELSVILNLLRDALYLQDQTSKGESPSIFKFDYGRIFCVGGRGVEIVIFSDRLFMMLNSDRKNSHTTSSKVDYKAIARLVRNRDKNIQRAFPIGTLVARYISDEWSLIPHSFQKIRFDLSWGDPIENLRRILSDISEEQGEVLTRAVGIIIIAVENENEIYAAIDGKTAVEIVELSRQLKSERKIDDELIGLFTDMLAPMWIQEQTSTVQKPKESRIRPTGNVMDRIGLAFTEIIKWVGFAVAVTIAWGIHLLGLCYATGFGIFHRRPTIWSVIVGQLKNKSRFKGHYLTVAVFAIILCVSGLRNSGDLFKVWGPSFIGLFLVLLGIIISIGLIVNQLLWPGRRWLAIPLSAFLIILYFLEIPYIGRYTVLLATFPYPWVWNIVWDRVKQDKISNLTDAAGELK